MDAKNKSTNEIGPTYCLSLTASSMLPLETGSSPVRSSKKRKTNSSLACAFKFISLKNETRLPFLRRELIEEPRQCYLYVFYSGRFKIYNEIFYYSFGKEYVGIIAVQANSVTNTLKLF